MACHNFDKKITGILKLLHFHLCIIEYKKKINLN